MQLDFLQAPVRRVRKKILELSSNSRSVRASLILVWLSVTLFTYILVNLSVLAFTYRAEQNAWRGRQREAARSAAESVAAVLQRAEDSLRLVTVADHHVFEEDPNILPNLLHQNKALLEVVRLDKNGVVLAGSYQTEPVLSNLFTIPQSEWFLQAKAGKRYYSKFNISAEYEPYLVIAQPVPDGGVVAARLSLSILWREVAEAHFGESGKVYVVLRDGDVIAHTNPAVVQAITNLAGQPEFQAVKLARGNEWYGEYTNFEGLQVVGATAAIPGTDWIVFTELPRSEAFATSRSALYSLGAVLLIFTGLGGWLVTHLLGPLVLAPVEKLRQGAERIGQGDMSYRIGLNRQDEIGQVAAAFDQMAVNLQQRTAELAASRDELVLINSQLSAANSELETEIAYRMRIEEQLQHDAFHDALTGLPNRALFMDRLSHAIERYHRNMEPPYAVLFLDLDRFKVINDSLGHNAGDQLLVNLAQRIQMLLRTSDTVARLGGDEFVILVEDVTHPESVLEVVERILHALKSPFHLYGNATVVSTSIGIVMGGGSYLRPDEVLRDADIALYRAKGLGKARYAIFDTTLRTHAIVRLDLENELRMALEREELSVLYQPIKTLATGRIAGFEALLRWNSAARGAVTPAEFIPIAEETGLIVPIGEWVLRQSCRQLMEWQRRFVTEPPLTINVNISGIQFRHPSLLEQINTILAETCLNPECLKLEITESMFVDNVEQGQQILFKLSGLGVQLQIDDFGTGYSSLSYLQRFPIHTIKIDRSFISRIGSNCGSNENGTEIVRTIVALARELGMETVAEGIETEEQMEQLRLLKCDAGQGYLIAHPMEPRMVEKLLEASFASAD